MVEGKGKRQTPRLDRVSTRKNKKELV